MSFPLLLVYLAFQNILPDIGIRYNKISLTYLLPVVKKYTSIQYATKKSSYGNIGEMQESYRELFVSRADTVFHNFFRLLSSTSSGLAGVHNTCW